MHNHYEDILSRIKEPPLWFDEVGVPRFDPFLPTRMSNIYAKEAVLLLIKCQCGTEFQVAMSDHLRKTSLADRIIGDAIHYGDPPNIRCCLSGPSSNSEPIRVLEYWHRSYSKRDATLAELDPLASQQDRMAAWKAMPETVRNGWDRNPEFEIELNPDWVAVFNTP